MTIPQCTITIGDVAALIGVDKFPLAGAEVLFTPNIREGELLPIESTLYRVEPVQGRIDNAGQLVDLYGDPGVTLLANDPVLNLEVPLEWKVEFAKTRIGGFSKTIGGWWFTAPSAGETIDLRNLSHVVGTWATGTTTNYIYADRPDTLTEGVSTLPRWLFNTVTVGSGTLRLTYLTCDKNVTVTDLVGITSTTAAAATPTLCRMGIYEVDESGDLTLVGSTLNDTGLFAATDTTYAAPLSSPVALAAGTRYAFAVLVVSGATLPTFVGTPIPASEAGLSPRLTGTVSSQTDLPSTIAAGSVSTAAAMYYIRAT